jgi:Domain of unknown function (DUF4136)
MKAVFLRSAVLGLAVALAGCATTTGPAPVDVTRFHLGQPIARGDIAVEPFVTQDPNSPEYRTYADAVARQLAAQGWNVVATVGQSEQVALVGFEQHSFQGPPKRGPVSIGLGGGTGGYRGGGVGAGVGFNLGGGRGSQLTDTMLQIRIKRRSDGTVFWEGRAEAQTRADRPEGQPAAVADRLAAALFRDFPGQSGETIRVK